MQRHRFAFPCGSRPRLQHREWAVLLLGGLLTSLLAPPSARAACSTFDLTTCMHAAQYAFWQGVAGELWSVNRTLLTLAYQLDVLRAWLVQTVFTSVFQIVTDAISPALVPIATIAVLVGVLCFLLMPLIGRVEIVNIRRALIWIVVAPLLLGIAGQGLAAAEQLRTSLGQTMFAAAQQVGTVPTFGVQSSEMQTATASLYPFSGCSGGALARPFSAGSSSTGLYIDDLAAALVYADAEDIHCPREGSGPGDELPDGFYSPPADYATEESVSDMDSQRSAEWVNKIQNGVTRLLMGLVPSLLAVMNAVIQLLFALALVLLFIALPLGLAVVFFVDTAAGVTGLARRMMDVLQTSWSSSLLLGIVFVALLATAQLGNAAAFVGLSLAGIFLTVFIIFIAIHAFMSSVRAIGQTVGLATGISAGAAGLALGGAAGALLAPARATRQVGQMGLNYTIARRAGTSRSYALGAAAGRIRGVARVGELASVLGAQGETLDGLYLGQRSARNREGLRFVRRTAEADARKPDASRGNTTMLEREEQHDLQRTVDRARRGSGIEQAGRAAYALAHPIAAARDGMNAIGPGVERVQELSGDMMQAAWERARAARDAVVERAGDTPTMMGAAAAVVAAASHGFVRDARSGRMISNGRGGITFLPRVAPAEIPAHARRERVANVNAGRLLQLGHHLQYNTDGTVTFWHPHEPPVEQDQVVQSTAGSSGRGGTRRRSGMPSTAPPAQPRPIPAVIANGARAGGSRRVTSPTKPVVPGSAGQPSSPGTTSSGSAMGAAPITSSPPGRARRSPVYPLPGSVSPPPAAHEQIAALSVPVAAPVASPVMRSRHVLRRRSHRPTWSPARRRVQAARQAVANAQEPVRQEGVATPEAAPKHARPNLAREQGRLRRQGLIAAAAGTTSAWRRSSRASAGRRRRAGPRRTQP